MVFRAAQQLHIVQFGPGQSSLERAAGRDQGFDQCLAQTRVLVIGVEESARAAARHLSPAWSEDA